MNIKYSLGGFFLFSCSLSCYSAEFKVTNTNDSGDGSLRNALLSANSQPSSSAHSILFNIPPNSPGCSASGQCTITLSSTLPEINVPMIIDGLSQNNYLSAPTTSPLIQLSGISLTCPYAGMPASGLFFNTAGGGSTVQGMAINSFPGEGIFLNASNDNKILSNYIGLDFSGSTTLGTGNGRCDVKMKRIGLGIKESSNNQISNNTISGNGIANIFMYKLGSVVPKNNVITDNKIGTDKTGMLKILGWRDTLQSLYIDSGQNNTISNNVITGTGGQGQIALLVNDDANTITNNKIGVGMDGEVNLSNKVGIKINGKGNILNSNIISGNGVGLIFAHYINPISGETIPPINRIENNSVENNIIGLTQSGQALGNDVVGIELQARSKYNSIQKNTVAYNGTESPSSNAQGGIVLTSTDENGNPSQEYPLSNKILSNVIFNNGGNGIDLVKNTTTLGFADGPTLNNSVGNIGPNSFQNYPLIAYERSFINPAQYKIYGSINGSPNEKYLLQFFANPNEDLTSYDITNPSTGQIVHFDASQGKYLIGQITVTTDATGSATFKFMAKNTLLYGNSLITSTATRLSTNETSEFSQAYAFDTKGNPKAYKVKDAKGKYANELELPNYCMELTDHADRKQCFEAYILQNNLESLVSKYRK